MGLDISFSRQAAIENGLRFGRVRNGDEYVIAEAEANLDDHDVDYITWLKEMQPVVYVPNRDYCVHDDGSEGTVVVRANKWGNTYYPLTAWLTEHGIEWDEF